MEAYDICSDLLSAIISSAIDESEAIEQMFQKGHVSPVSRSLKKNVSDIEPEKLDLSALFSDYSDSEERSDNVDEELLSKESSDTDIDEIVSCEYHCELKNYLFRCISDVEQCKKQERVDRYLHICEDLLIATGEVQKRLELILNEPF